MPAGEISHLASPFRYPHPMPNSVTVRVPATSANLGPGFDSIGLALDITQDVTLQLGQRASAADGLERLVLDAARSAYRLAKVPVPELRASGQQAIPIGRGLGASAAARAAGIVAANVMMGGPLDDAQTLTLGAGLEGHADNMAPALFGGLRVVVRDGDRYTHVAASIAPGLKVVLFVPDFEMPTGESRKLLPVTLSKEDAVHNIGRAALLVAALARGEWGALDLATQDRLHQPARARIFPAMSDLFAAAKGAGALCAYLSGGGSTIAAFALDGEERIAAAMLAAGQARGYSGRTVVAQPRDAGAEIVARG
jgi:homoserine kinase